ncbi:MmcQ/YjbR family DNA-binding protein [Allosaccharopolyspora coralli]|uniref:MmcQ/YjbR family DNA-binding protein n=1 Tax=Allosaccharopolyspora coralli TaxID=2665642 RepID=A0A5Q3Q9V4_9PSEU|nr:MmcQ/YjbR family DNA-binding protein [Allosaccharopolyspora coralli]QGK68245.1 MmcQ/YjbR family DNA-binding protein [Allosaccharopolyspora coralli]
MSSPADLREIALSLPDTSEKAAWGMPTFRVRGKIFASLSDPHGPGVKISPEERAELVAAEPEKFTWTTHDEKFGFMRLRLDALDREELAEILTDAWRRAAPKTLVRGFDAED